MNNDKGYKIDTCNKEQLIESVKIFINGKWVEKFYCEKLNMYLDYK